MGIVIRAALPLTHLIYFLNLSGVAALAFEGHRNLSGAAALAFTGHCNLSGAAAFV